MAICLSACIPLAYEVVRGAKSRIAQIFGFSGRIFLVPLCCQLNALSAIAMAGQLRFSIYSIRFLDSKIQWPGARRTKRREEKMSESGVKSRSYYVAQPKECAVHITLCALHRMFGASAKTMQAQCVRSAFCRSN